jgi:hypothetical protein
VKKCYTRTDFAMQKSFADFATKGRHPGPGSPRPRRARQGPPPRNAET